MNSHWNKAVWKGVALASILLCVYVVGCNEGVSMHLPTDVGKLKEKIQQYVPVGTSVSNAQAMMESHGFRCEQVRNGGFKEWVDGRTEGPSFHGIDYLYCTVSKKQIIGFRVWDIAFVHENGTITNIIVRTRKFGIGDL